MAPPEHILAGCPVGIAPMPEKAFPIGFPEKCDIKKKLIENDVKIPNWQSSMNISLNTDRNVRITNTSSLQRFHQRLFLRLLTVERAKD